MSSVKGKRLVKILSGIITAVFLLTVTLSLFSGCSTSGYKKNNALDTTKEVKLVITGGVNNFQAMEYVIQKFTEIYPNCQVEYEYMQSYESVIIKRLQEKSGQVDLMITQNIQSTTPLLPYALNLSDYKEQLALTDISEALTSNYVFQQDGKSLYSIPLGTEMRVLYANKTLLQKYGLSVPKNGTELLAACKTLKENGYIAMQGNPSNFGQQLVFPYSVHILAAAENKEELYEKVRKCDDDAAEIFRAPLEFLYEIVENGYYNYKFVETEYGRFLDASDEMSTKSFLGISKSESGEDVVESVGSVAFMTGASTLLPVLDKAKDDYHSEIEYECILAPVSESGGFAHVSPVKGLSINKDGENLDCSLEFCKFFFTKEINEAFANDYNIAPNTSGYKAYLGKKFGIAEDHITAPEDVTFDYGFYNIVIKPMLDISKSNNPKYMTENANGEKVMYDFEHYMDALKTAFKNQQEIMNAKNG